jgi:tRNA(Arg) A34 adenosine deaminase TadA
MKFVRRIAIDNNGVRKRFKLAAALAHKKTIISIGTNELRTHPLQGKFRKNNDAVFLHAEIAAIANALNHMNKDDLRDSTLYVHRVKRKSSLNQKDWIDGLALPCEGCTSAIMSFGIKRVVYSTDEQDIYGEIDVQANEQA